VCWRILILLVPRPSYSFSSSTFASALEDLPADTPAWEGDVAERRRVRHSGCCAGYVAPLHSLPSALRRKTCVKSAQIVSLVRLIFAPFSPDPGRCAFLRDRSPLFARFLEGELVVSAGSQNFEDERASSKWTAFSRTRRLKPPPRRRSALTHHHPIRPSRASCRGVFPG